jgi:type I restriction enzyme S subunit
MTTQNKNVPALRFSEFNEDWQIKKLGEISDISKLAGFEYSKHVIYKDTGKIIALRALNIKNNRLNLSEVKYIDDSDFSKLSRSKLYVGDLMFTYIGANIGDVALIDKNDKYYLAPNVARIRSNKENLSPFFIIQYFNISAFLKQEIYGYIASSSQPALSMENIRKFKVATPTLPEQQKIAAFLTAVDEKIQQLTKKKDLLEQYKKGVTRKIFNQEIRFKDDNSNDFADWEEKKLGEVCNINKGEQLNASELTLIGDYPALNGGINPSGYTDKWNKEKNTITISEGGNSCGYVNFVTQKFWCGGHCYALENLRPTINNLFLYQILKHNESAIMRLRVGSGLPNIQKKDVNNFLIQMPKINEQIKIANFLSAIDDKINLVNQQLEKTKEYKKGLLQQMFV